jgi:nucleotide-binding universal stress UspA family protein
MSSILGFSTEQGTDDLVAEHVIAKAKEIGATTVVMVAHGGMNTTEGHGLGQLFLPGESAHESADRAEAMCAAARAQGLDATPQAAMGPEGKCVDAACERFAPTAIVVGTPRHRLVGDLWDAESVRAAKHHCADVEALHD